MTEGTPPDAWERAWSERYETVRERTGAQEQRRRTPAGGQGLRGLLVATLVLGIAVASVAFAGGGKRVSQECRSKNKTCVTYVNKGKGPAARFKTKGSVPFTIKDTNEGLVEHLNADMLDGSHAADFLAKGERATDSALLQGRPASSFLRAGAKATDSALLEGQPPSAFLGAGATAADSALLDGQDSSAFLGATAKAADADKLDGVESDDYTKVSGAVFADGSPAAFGFTVNKAGTGIYQVSLDTGTFPNSGGNCSTLFAVASALGTAANIAVIESTGCATNGGGIFTVRTFTAAAAPVDSSFTFIADARP